MDNTSSNIATIPVLWRGLRRFDIQNKDFILIFIHDLQSWSVSKLWEFLCKRISNCNKIVHRITKNTRLIWKILHFKDKLCDKPIYYQNILFILTRCLLICKINWIKTNKIRTFSYVKKFNNKFSSSETKSMVKDFLYYLFIYYIYYLLFSKKKKKLYLKILII